MTNTAKEQSLSRGYKVLLQDGKGNIVREWPLWDPSTPLVDQLAEAWESEIDALRDENEGCRREIATYQMEAKWRSNRMRRLERRLAERQEALIEKPAVPMPRYLTTEEIEELYKEKRKNSDLEQLARALEVTLEAAETEVRRLRAQLHDMGKPDSYSP